MRLAVGGFIAAGVALVGASVIAATPLNPTLPTAEVPAIQLSAEFSQDMDQEFFNLLQLLGPDADDLVRESVDFPESVSIDGADLDGLNPATVPPDLADDLGDFTLPPALWTEVFGPAG